MGRKRWKLICIAFILFRKRRHRQRHINDPTWAGPTPFLDGSVGVGRQPRLMADENAEDGPRESKRISLTGFFPHRLSRRLSHLKEVDEQVLMTDITQGSTFGRAEETKLGSGNGIAPDQNQNQNQDKGQNQDQDQDQDQDNDKDKDQDKDQNQEPNKDQEKNQELNQNQIQTQDDTTISTSGSPSAEQALAPPPAQLEDISPDLAPSEATPPPPQLDENHLVPPPALVLQEVDLGPPASEMDIPPPPPSEIPFVPPPPPPLPSST